jgi:uncharacterized repeat protein (TIGR03803 family)
MNGFYRIPMEMSVKLMNRKVFRSMIKAASLHRCLPRIAALLLLTAAPLSAQTFTTVYNFNGYPGAAGYYGNSPSSGLILSGKTFYGATAGGGINGAGAVYSINTDGSGYRTLYSSYARGTEAGFPNGDLILSGKSLYGTQTQGNGLGLIYSLNTDGSGFTILYSSPADHSSASGPNAGLVLSGKTFYATTVMGGTNGDGTIFAVKTDGTGFTNLYTFTGGADGSSPNGGMILVGKTLYGTAAQGGTNGEGSVFSINTDGTGFTNLYSFTGGNDGEFPNGGLILVGKTLYGTAANGGTNGFGSVFSINTDGSGFTTLYSFNNEIDGYLHNGNGGLILVGKTLYGTATLGGINEAGSIFSINTDGTGFTTLYSFTDGNDGGAPNGSLVLVGKTLYGTAAQGGTNGVGSVFSLSLLEPISVSAAPTNWGNVTGGGNITKGTLITVKATAKTGYDFVNWTEGNNVVSTSPSYTFVVNTPRTLVANFAMKATLKVIASPAVGGTVKGGGTFASGSSQVVTATAKKGYSFTNWTSGINVVSTAEIDAFTLSTNTTLTAHFIKIPRP